MTKVNAETDILLNKLEKVEFTKAEEQEAHHWFGKDYLGNGLIRCDFCKQTAVPFKGWLAGHVCSECSEFNKIML